MNKKPQNNNNFKKQNGNAQQNHSNTQQFRVKQCPHKLNCQHLLKPAGCRNNHHDLDYGLARTFQNIKKHQESAAIGFFENNQIVLLQNPKFPLHLLEEIQNIKQKFYYLVGIDEYDNTKQSIGAFVIEEIGPFNDLATEQNIMENRRQQTVDRKYFKDFQIKIDGEENKKQGKVYTGKFVVKPHGEKQIKCGDFKKGVIFDRKFWTDSNRAIHDSRVEFIQKTIPNANPKIILGEVINVTYPNNLKKCGYLTIDNDRLCFVAMDKRYDQMLVREIQDEVYQNLKKIGESEYFSYLCQTKINEQYLEKYFFRAEFIGWSPFEKAPYCRIIQELGPIEDVQNYKKIILQENGITKEMYPKKALEEAQSLAEDFDKIIEEQMTQRNLTSDEFIFTIDNASTAAIDDAISIQKTDDKIYQLGIHISDLSLIVLPNSSLDQEAFKRAASRYVLGDFFQPMFPYSLNSGICSLQPCQKRLAISLYVKINDDGLIDCENIEYKMSIIESRVKLSYEKANQLIQEGYKGSEEEEIKEGQENNEDEVNKQQLCTEEWQRLEKDLKTLSVIMQKRREIRKQVQNNIVDQAMVSSTIVEEAMLISSTVLPLYKDKIIEKSEILLKDLIEKQDQEKAKDLIPLLSKSSSIKASEVSNVEEVLMSEIDFQDALKRQASEGGENYLNSVFKTLKVNFEKHSRKAIDESFELARNSKQGTLLKDYLDTVYAKNYQHFAYIIQRNPQPQNLVEDQKEEEKSELPIIQNPEQSLEIKEGEQELIEKLSQLQIKEKEINNPYDIELNKQALRNIHSQQVELQIKYSNPIREYCHLLSNRLLVNLIELNNLVEKKGDSQDYLEKLSSLINQIQFQLGKQILYQKEVKLIQQIDQKMKNAEREIDRIYFAFGLIQQKETNNQRALITKNGNVYKQAWHPVIQDFDINEWGKKEQVGEYEEVDVIIQLKRLVPLEFKAKAIDKIEEKNIIQ